MSEFHSAALLPGYENPARTEIPQFCGTGWLWSWSM